MQYRFYLRRFTNSSRYKRTHSPRGQLRAHQAGRGGLEVDVDLRSLEQLLGHVVLVHSGQLVYDLDKVRVRDVLVDLVQEEPVSEVGVERRQGIASHWSLDLVDCVR